MREVSVGQGFILTGWLGYLQKLGRPAAPAAAAEYLLAGLLGGQPRPACEWWPPPNWGKSLKSELTGEKSVTLKKRKKNTQELDMYT